MITFVVEILPRQIFLHYQKNGGLDAITAVTRATYEDMRGCVYVQFPDTTDTWSWVVGENNYNRWELTNTEANVAVSPTALNPFMA